MSDASTLVPEDNFAPAVPSGLHIDRTGNEVALVWELRHRRADLAGYRVYRSEGTGPWQKLADVNAVPTYADATVRTWQDLSLRRDRIRQGRAQGE